MLGSLVLGAWTLGESAGESANPKLIADYASITVTGNTVGLVRDARIGADAGSFTLAGFSVTDVNIAGVGHFTLSGQDVVMRRTYRPLKAEVGGFSYDGGAVTMDRRTSKPYPARPSTTGRPFFRATGVANGGFRARAVSGD